MSIRRTTVIIANQIVGDIAWTKIDGVPSRVGTFTAEDEANLDALVAETDTALGSYTRVASASSLAAGQFHYGSGVLQLVSATGNDVHPYWHAGEVFTLGSARFTLATGASTVGTNRVQSGIAISSGTLPAVNASGTLTHKGVLARTSDLARVARTGEYDDLLDKPDLSIYTKTADLAGRETDRYASYNNGIVNSGYRTGDWSLFTGSGAPSGSGDRTA